MKIDEMALTTPRQFILVNITRSIARFSIFGMGLKTAALLIWVAAVNNFGVFSAPESWVGLEFVFIPVILTMWFLDAHYLRLERVLRHHYDKIVTGKSDDLYSFSLSAVHLMKTEPLLRSLFSKIQVVYYGALILTCLAVINPYIRLTLS